MKRLTVFKKLVTAATVGLTLTACQLKNPVVFSGKDNNGNTADFIMAVSPKDTSTKLIWEKLSEQFQGDRAVQDMLGKQNKIVFVGAEGCNGLSDEENAQQIRLTLLKELSQPKFLNKKETLSQSFKFEKFQSCTITPGKAPKKDPRIITIGVTNDISAVNLNQALINGFGTTKVQNLKLENYALFELIYKPDTEKTAWQTPKIIEGKDSAGATVVFDIYVLNIGRWESGKNNQIIVAGEPVSLQKLDYKPIEDSLAIADEVISAGAADCQGKRAEQEALAATRAANLQDRMMQLSPRRKKYPEYRKLVLGQFKSGDCPNNPNQLQLQRPVIIIFANKAHNGQVNIEEAWKTALNNSVNKEKLGGLELEKYSLGNVPANKPARE